MQIVSAERARGERFYFHRSGELMVSEGILPDTYPEVLAPETAIEGSDRTGHMVQSGDLLLEAGPERGGNFRLSALRVPNVFIETDPQQERAVVNADKQLIDIRRGGEGMGRFMDMIIVNHLIARPETSLKEVKRVADRVGTGHQFLLNFQRSGLVAAYVEGFHPEFVPQVEPSRKLAEAA